MRPRNIATAAFVVWILLIFGFTMVDNPVFKIAGTFFLVAIPLLFVWFLVSFNNQDREEVRHHTVRAIQRAIGDAPRELFGTSEGLLSLFGCIALVCAMFCFGGHDMDAVMFDHSSSDTQIGQAEVAWTWAFWITLAFSVGFLVRVIIKHMPKKAASTH